MTQESEEVIVVNAPGPDREAAVPRELTRRRLKFAKGDFETHGYTAGCPGCLFYETGIGTRAGHTEECRARMEEAIATTEAGARRVAASRSRTHGGFLPPRRLLVRGLREIRGIWGRTRRGIKEGKTSP